MIIILYYEIIFVVVVGIKNMASTSEQKYNICEKYFHEQIFNLHQRVHSEDKFHPCNKNCGKVFISKDELLSIIVMVGKFFPLNCFPVIFAENPLNKKII